MVKITNNFATPISAAVPVVAPCDSHVVPDGVWQDDHHPVSLLHPHLLGRLHGNVHGWPTAPTYNHKHTNTHTHTWATWQSNNLRRHGQILAATFVGPFKLYRQCMLDPCLIKLAKRSFRSYHRGVPPPWWGGVTSAGRACLHTYTTCPHAARTQCTFTDWGHV